MRLSLMGVLIVCLSAAAARAASAPVKQLPALSARDVTGTVRTLPGLLAGHERTLLVAVTSRSATEKMRAWFDAADARAPRDVQRVSIVSIHVPFFVSDDYARAKARQEVPRDWWDESLLDTDQAMAKRLALPKDRTPTAMALDAQGRVLVEVHGTVDTPGSDAIWRALGD